MQYSKCSKEKGRMIKAKEMQYKYIYTDIAKVDAVAE